MSAHDASAARRPGVGMGRWYATCSCGWTQQWQQWSREDALAAAELHNRIEHLAEQVADCPDCWTTGRRGKPEYWPDGCPTHGKASA